MLTPLSYGTRHAMFQLPRLPTGAPSCLQTLSPPLLSPALRSPELLSRIHMYLSTLFQMVPSFLGSLPCPPPTPNPSSTQLDVSTLRCPRSKVQPTWESFLGCSQAPQVLRWMNDSRGAVLLILSVLQPFTWRVLRPFTRCFLWPFTQSVLQPSGSPSALHTDSPSAPHTVLQPFTQSLLWPFTVSSNPSHRVSFSPSHSVSAGPSHGVSSGPSHRVSSSPSHGESFSLSHRASCTQNTPNPWVLNWMPWEIQPCMGLEGNSCPFSVSYAESTSTVKFLIPPKVSRRKTKRGLLWRSSRLEKTMKFSS